MAFKAPPDMAQSALKLFMTAGLALGWPGQKLSPEQINTQGLQAAATTTSLNFTQPLLMSREDSLLSAQRIEPLAPFPSLKMFQSCDPGRSAAIVMDANTGQVICSHNQDEPRVMASMAKTMLLYIVAEELEAGRLNLDDRLTVRQRELPGHYDLVTLDVTPEDVLTVRQAILGVAVASAADASNILAYNIAGSVDAFVKRMNETAARLGMKKTNYMNTHGGPVRDYNPKNKPLPFKQQNYTTVHNMAILLRDLHQDFPFMVDMMKTKSFHYDAQFKKSERETYQNWAIKSGAEFGKTGYIKESQYNIMAYDNGKIAVLMGTPNPKTRTQILNTLLQHGHDIIQKIPIEPWTNNAEAENDIIAVDPGTIGSLYMTPVKPLNNAPRDIRDTKLKPLERLEPAIQPRRIVVGPSL